MRLALTRPLLPPPAPPPPPPFLRASAAVQIATAKWSFAGFITATNAFTVAKFPGVVFLICAGCWTAEALWSLNTLRMIYADFRGRGGSAKGSMASMKAEAGKAATKGAIKGMFNFKK